MSTTRRPRRSDSSGAKYCSKTDQLALDESGLGVAGHDETKDSLESPSLFYENPGPGDYPRWLEAISWRLAVEVMRRRPGELRMIETHMGGGQYDQLTIYRRRDLGQGSPFLISLNRVGSAFFKGPNSEPWREIWTAALGAKDPKTTVDELERRAGLITRGWSPA